MIDKPKGAQIAPQIQFQEPDGSVGIIETPDSTHKLMTWNNEGKDVILCNLFQGALRQFPQKGVEGVMAASRIPRSPDGTFRNLYAYFAALVAMCVLLCGGCAGVPAKTAVSLVETEKAIMRAWAASVYDKVSTDQLNQKVLAAHRKFMQAQKVALVAFQVAQENGDQNAAKQALETLRLAIPPLLELIAPVVAPAKIEALRQQAMSATKI